MCTIKNSEFSWWLTFHGPCWAITFSLRWLSTRPPSCILIGGRPGLAYRVPAAASSDAFLPQARMGSWVRRKLLREVGYRGCAVERVWKPLILFLIVKWTFSFIWRKLRQVPCFLERLKKSDPNVNLCYVNSIMIKLQCIISGTPAPHKHSYWFLSSNKAFSHDNPININVMVLHATFGENYSSSVINYKIISDLFLKRNKHSWLMAVEHWSEFLKSGLTWTRNVMVGIVICNIIICWCKIWKNDNVF